MPIYFAPLESPIIDPQNEAALVERALVEVRNASGAILNDFSSSSPARALIEGQAFAGAELLYYVNRLPEALAIEFLKIAGIQRRLGIAAKATITFTLSASLSTSFVVPQNYKCKTNSGVAFTTDEVLVIPAGQTQGSVVATCTQLGTAGNVGAYTIRSLTQPLAFLSGCTNTAPATGGLNEETLDEVKSRAFAAIRRRGLVTADDYNNEAIGVLGAGSVAYTIGNLSADKTSYNLGSVHVFCLNRDGSLLSEAQRAATQTALQNRSHVSTAVYVSNIDLVDTDISVVARLIPGTNPESVADAIFARLVSYLEPGRLQLGQTIILKEVEYVIRGAGVEFVQSVAIGEKLQPRISTNFALPYPYSAAKLNALTVELTSENSTVPYVKFYGTNYFGSGDPD